MSNRLLTDTCAAIKLAALGDKLFEKGALPGGDLILHPKLFQETRKWPKDKKELYANELSILAKIRATSGLVKSGSEVQAQIALIDMTQEELGRSIGRTDKELLAAILLDEDMGLVTNDGAFFAVASEGFSIDSFCAEDILIEAINHSVVTVEEAQALLERWEVTGDSVLNSAKSALKAAGLRID